MTEAPTQASGEGGSEPDPDREPGPDGQGHEHPAEDGTRSADKGRSAAGALFAAAREIVLVLVVALGLSLLIKTFLVQAFFIPSVSMENTLLVGDRVLVSKLTPGPFDLKHGDVVVFADSGKWLTSSERPTEGPVREAIRSGLMFVGLLPADSDEHLIKRVIGLPGDKVACCEDNQGRVTVNGTPIDEPYLYPGDAASIDPFSITVPAGRLWVMGDHRSDSADSRAHPDSFGGTIPLSDVVGKAFVKVWPLDRIDTLSDPPYAKTLP
jgi:signal peptidase I